MVESIMKQTILKISIIVFAFLFQGCAEDQQEKQSTKKPVKNQLTPTPQVNPDSLYQYVVKQVGFGPRTPNSEAHEKCADYLVGTLKSYGLVVSEQTGVQKAHDGSKLNFRNITARFMPERKNRILLTAHWDTRPWADQDSERTEEPIDGANDAGSGVAVILEIARLLQIQNPAIGVDFVLFDIEDYGVSEVENSFCYGSQYWSKNSTLTENPPMFGINLDMVGDPGATFLYEGYSMQYARNILDKVWSAAHRLGHHRYFVRQQSYYIIDDHLWVNKAGIPCIDIIHKDMVSGSFAKSWHTHDDNLKNISPQTLKAVTETLMQVIYREK